MSSDPLAFDPRPVILRDPTVCPHVAVVPLEREHAADLLAFGVDAESWRWMPRLALRDLQDAHGFVRAARADAEDGSSVAFAIVVPASADGGSTGARERCVGTTRFLAIDRPHRRLEIGWTLLAPAVCATHVNPATKYLLLRHAFETLGARRVEFKTDSENLRSRRAIEKLGASFEGIFRKHRIRPDGTNRDTAWYAIVDDDWAGVRARLLARLRGA